jgi:hypothetical protein
MTALAKFYLHDATSPNQGLMPTFSPANFGGGKVGAGTEATGATTARDASALIGTAQATGTCTAAATTTAQRLGLRRFVTPPLAPFTFTVAMGNWTYSIASFESNAAHNGKATGVAYFWRPATGTQVGTDTMFFVPAEPGTTQTPQSVTATWGVTTTITNGDIIVLDIYDEFTQGGAVARTFTFCYDGTTEASTTSNASFLSSPVALTLAQPLSQPTNLSLSPGMLMEKLRDARKSWRKRRSGMLVPDLWLPTPATI